MHFCQSAEAAGEGTTDGEAGLPDLVGRAAAVLQVKAEGDIFNKLQLIVATVSSLGH